MPNKMKRSKLISIVSLLVLGGGAGFFIWKYDGLAKLHASSFTKVASQGNEPADGLVGLWSFDGSDISGATLLDRSGLGNNGILPDSPTLTRGKVGQALEFDGVDDYVKVPNTPSLDFGTGDFTISVWVNLKSAGHFIFGGKFDLHFDEGNTVLDFRKPEGTEVSSLKVPSTGEWTHIVIRRKNGTLQYFFNATPDASMIDNDDFNGTSDLFFGSRNEHRDFLSGKMDEVRIYNRALSEEEIEKLYRLNG